MTEPKTPAPDRATVAPAAPAAAASPAKGPAPTEGVPNNAPAIPAQANPLLQNQMIKGGPRPDGDKLAT